MQTAQHRTSAELRQDCTPDSFDLRIRLGRRRARLGAARTGKPRERNRGRRGRRKQPEPPTMPPLTKVVHRSAISAVDVTADGLGNGQLHGSFVEYTAVTSSIWRLRPVHGGYVQPRSGAAAVVLHPP